MIMSKKVKLNTLTVRWCIFMAYLSLSSQIWSCSVALCAYEPFVCVCLNMSDRAIDQFRSAAYRPSETGLFLPPGCNAGVYFVVVTGQGLLRMMNWAVDPISSLRVRDFFSIPMKRWSIPLS